MTIETPTIIPPSFFENTLALKLMNSVDGFQI